MTLMTHHILLSATSLVACECDATLRSARTGLENGRLDKEFCVEVIAVLEPIAQRCLTLTVNGVSDPWLWEHSQRVATLAQDLRKLPDYGEEEVPADSLRIAAWFGCAGWALQVEQGDVQSAAVLATPTNNVQRELGATLLQDKAADQLDNPAIRLAIDSIRECNDRATSLPSAQVLSDAENLAAIGVVEVLREFRQYQAEGRTVLQLVQKWQRQQEYHYWEARINDSFRGEGARVLARTRLAGVEQLMQVLARELHTAEAAV